MAMLGPLLTAGADPLRIHRCPSPRNAHAGGSGPSGSPNGPVRARPKPLAILPVNMVAGTYASGLGEIRSVPLLRARRRRVFRRPPVQSSDGEGPDCLVGPRVNAQPRAEVHPGDPGRRRFLRPAAVGGGS